MPKQTSSVLLVGNCGPDEARLRGTLDAHFAVEIDATMYVEKALAMMRARRYDLVLVNRLVFADDSPGIELLMRAQADAELRDIPVMMISNLAEAQAKSQAAGGEPGFGKDNLESAATVERLSEYLPRQSANENA